MGDVIFAALLDAIKAEFDLRTGNADAQDAKDSSVRFLMALYSLIDQRIDANIEERKKFKSQEKLSIKNASYLNSAPPPLEEVDLDDNIYVREWFVQYKHWYQRR